jgi:hypothetical protein
VEILAKASSNRLFSICTITVSLWDRILTVHGDRKTHTFPTRAFYPRNSKLRQKERLLKTLLWAVDETAYFPTNDVILLQTSRCFLLVFGPWCGNSWLDPSAMSYVCPMALKMNRIWHKLDKNVCFFKILRLCTGCYRKVSRHEFSHNLLPATVFLSSLVSLKFCHRTSCCSGSCCPMTRHERLSLQANIRPCGIMAATLPPIHSYSLIIRYYQLKQRSQIKQERHKQYLYGFLLGCSAV